MTFSSYITFFVAFQVLCSFFATVFMALNAKRLFGNRWFAVFLTLFIGFAIYTFRRGMLLLASEASTSADTLIWQSLISVMFLISSAMAYGLLAEKK